MYLLVKSHVTEYGEELGVGVCARAVVLPMGSGQLEFSLVWDMPVIHFGANEQEYLRYDTKL